MERLAGGFVSLVKVAEGGRKTVHLRGRGRERVGSNSGSGSSENFNFEVSFMTYIFGGVTLTLRLRKAKKLGNFQVAITI